MIPSRNSYAFVMLVTLFVAPISLSAWARSNDHGTRHSTRLTSGEAFVLDAHPSTTGSIREEIADPYKARYQQWKAEFLSTQIGQAQWELYGRHPRLVLTITVSPDNQHGAGSGKYKWNASGELIEATVTLGSRLDEGFPNSVYYPVMNALEPYEKDKLISGNVLAATKIAHEFGHVMKMGTIQEPQYHLQLRLAPIYNKIFLSNGNNVDDPRLVELARQMGVTRFRFGRTESIGVRRTLCSTCGTAWLRKAFTAGYSTESSALSKSTRNPTRSASPRSRSLKA